MKKILGITAVIAVMAMSISSVEALNVTLADVRNGLAVIEGNQAARDTNISWESNDVGRTNRGGNFSFSSVVPADCVGSLTIGTETLDVSLSSCTPSGGGGSAGPAPVAKTGQTTSYAPGDDGDLEKGVAVTPRFNDNLNGTITDNLTGLIWLQNANCFGLRSWAQALLDANGLASNSCGLTDESVAGNWRLPNRNELTSLFDLETFEPALPSGHPFTDLQFQVANYWSSTTYSNRSYAWVVNFSDGGVGIGAKTVGGFNGESYVLAVRGGS